MTKKCVLIGGGLALLATLIFGGTYVRTAVHKAKVAVEDAEPLSFKLDRLDTMVKDLDPEIRKAMHIIAKEEVAVEALKEEVTESDERLAKSQKDVFRLKQDLESDNSYFVYAGQSYTKEQVERDLRSRFERHKGMQSAHDSVKQQLEARESSLTAAREKLTAMQNKKQELEVALASLRARQKALEVLQTSSDLNLDDSKLARTKDLAKDIEARIVTAEKVLNAQAKYPGEINLDQPEDKDTLKEVAEYFGEKRPEKASVVNK